MLPPELDPEADDGEPEPPLGLLEPVEPPLEPLEPLLEPFELLDPELEPLVPLLEPLEPLEPELEPEMEPLDPLPDPLDPALEPLPPLLEPLLEPLEPFEPFGRFDPVPADPLPLLLPLPLLAPLAWPPPPFPLLPVPPPLLAPEGGLIGMLPLETLVPLDPWLEAFEPEFEAPWPEFGSSMAPATSPVRCKVTRGGERELRLRLASSGHETGNNDTSSLASPSLSGFMSVVL